MGRAMSSSISTCKHKDITPLEYYGYQLGDFLCLDCGHVDSVRGTKCPYCKNKRVDRHDIYCLAVYESRHWLETPKHLRKFEMERKLEQFYKK